MSPNPFPASKADVRFLADDLLEAREAGTHGHDLASLYVETQYRSELVEWTPEHLLRHAVYVGDRPDKVPREVRRERCTLLTNCFQKKGLRVHSPPRREDPVR